MTWSTWSKPQRKPTNQIPNREAILETNNDAALQLDIVIDGKRLRDIADLPLNLLA